MKSVVSVIAAILASGPALAEPMSILAGTAADMTHVEFEAAARRGAVALWALGAIEQHGPHLPLATDVYVPQAQLAGVAARLSARGVESVVLPPYYWGVNHVTGAFAGSINIRPEVMAALMTDVFQSLKAAGFREVYCITGHWDAVHARTIARAVSGWNDPALRVRFVVPTQLADRLTLDGPAIIRAALPIEPTPFPDVHAGDDETSVMLGIRNDMVRADIARRLPPAKLDPKSFEAWRTGGEVAKRITPEGYVGDPARADAGRGRARTAANAAALAAAILEDHGGRRK